jgi:hypothetical protein
LDPGQCVEALAGKAFGEQWQEIRDGGPWGATQFRPVTIEDVSAAIVVVLILVGIGIVVDQLLRLRKWLQKSPPGQDVQEPPDADT